MRLRRITMACLLALWLTAVLVPAAALASGPSAGDQQYTDPLGGSNGSGSKGSGSSNASKGSGSSNGSSSSGSSTSSSSSSASSSSSGTTVSSTSSAPVATTASSSSTDPASTSTLPRTGYDAWLAVGVGVMLLGAGMTVRLRARRV